MYDPEEVCTPAWMVFFSVLAGLGIWRTRLNVDGSVDTDFYQRDQ